jgi:superfamily II DNA or RNA helicase
MRSYLDLLPDKLKKAYQKSFEERPYQEQIIHSALKNLKKQTNTVIELPAGLGKTLIGQIIAALWANSRKVGRNKILIVLPNRLSLTLYYEHISWVRTKLKVLCIDQNIMVAGQQITENLQDTDVLLTNPRIITNVITRNTIPITIMQAFGLVIFDGSENLFLRQKNEGEPVDNQFDLLMAILALSKPSFLILGTQYLESHGWNHLLQPKLLTSDESLSKDYIPHVIIKVQGVFDPEIIQRDQMLRGQMAASVSIIRQDVWEQTTGKHPLRMKQVINQMRWIADGTKDKFYINFRKKSPVVIQVEEKTKAAFQDIVKIVDARLLLFEDLLVDLDSARIPPGLEDVWKARISTRMYAYKVNLKGKIKIIHEIVKEKGSKRGLIFCRNLEVCERLAGIFVGLGKQVYLIHNDISVSERQERIKNFKRYKSSLLLMTRYMGSKGFDVPEADYAVFYSPKDEEQVMWQEISRIRSTRKDPKEVFLLYYRKTGEEDKLNRLLWRMKSRSSYQITQVSHSQPGETISKEKTKD